MRGCKQATSAAPAPSYAAARSGGATPQVLRERVPMIAESGVTCVWLPPPSDSVSPQGYLPRDLYDLNSAYGTEVGPGCQERY